MNQSNEETVDTLVDTLLADDRSPHFAIGYLGNMIRRYMEADDSVDENVKAHIGYLKESV